MKKRIQKLMLQGSAGVFIGLVAGVEDALAQQTTTGTGGNNNFSSIAENVIDSISGLPALLSGVAYMLGLLLAVLGILKIKEHVENPSSVKLNDGAIRLAAGGGMFAIPIVSEAMRETVGSDGTAVEASKLNAVQFELK